MLTIFFLWNIGVLTMLSACEQSDTIPRCLLTAKPTQLPGIQFSDVCMASGTDMAWFISWMPCVVQTFEQFQTVPEGMVLVTSRPAAGL